MSDMAKHASPETIPDPAKALPVAAGYVAERLRGRPWPLLLIAIPAAVAVWSGWVGLAGLCGFGPIHPLPGIADGFHLNTAITLPVGIESYGAYALYACLAGAASESTRKFAAGSAAGALILGCLGQVSYHLLTAFHISRPPVIVVVLVACLPVITLFLAAALAHMMLRDARAERDRRAAAEARKQAAADARKPGGTGTGGTARKRNRTRKPSGGGTSPRASAGTAAPAAAPEPDTGEVPVEDSLRIMEIMDQGYTASEAQVICLMEKGHSASKAGVLAGKSDGFGRQVARKARDPQRPAPGTAPATGEQPRVQ